MRKILILLTFALVSWCNVNAQTYCTTGLYTTGCVDDMIVSFSTTGGITNNNSGCGGGASGYTYYSTMTHTGVQSTTVNFSLTSDPNWPEGHKIWVDWNNNGSFEDAGELMFNPTVAAPAGTIETGSFTIPLTATPGVKRMRVRGVYASTTFTSCSSEDYGEIEDYNLQVTSLMPCAGKPNAGTAEAPVTTQCPNTSFNLSLSGSTTASGLTYQWQSRPTSGGAWANISGATTKSYTLASGVPVNTDFRAYVTCTNGGLTDTSTIASVTVGTLAPAGTYTINKAMPTGNGNFQSFTDAVNYIKCGIAGPIVFNVAMGSGPYTEQVTFPQIIGSSTTNRITINGNGETLTFSGGTVTNPNTLSLDGADYFVFNYLNIEATGGEYGIAAHLYNAADNNKFSNCTFISSITGVYFTQAAFVISGAAATVVTAGLSGGGNIVDSCTMIGGHYSAVIYGNSTTPYTVDNQITNSTAKDFYTNGIYNVYARNTIIRHNIVERVNRTNTSLGAGISLSTGSYNCIVDRNWVRRLFDGDLMSTAPAYCLYNAASGAAGFENKWTNNLVSDIRSNGPIFGMLLVGKDYVQVYHNTISLDDASSTSTFDTYGINAYGNPLDIKNNIVTISRGGTGTKYCLYLSTSMTTTSDNNVLYMNAGAGTNYVAYRSGAYATLGAWQTATSLDMHSFSVDPLYSSPSTDEYVPTEPSIDNMGAAVGVLKDITGVNRSTTTPDPGAYEYVILPCTGTPAPGNTVANVTTYCPNIPIHLSLQNSSLGSGITYEWQSADDAAFTTNVVSLGTASTQTTSQTAAKYYRCKVTCTNSGLFTYSTPVFINMNTWTNCYCTPTTSGGTTYYISGFTTIGGSTNINKTTSTGSASGYQDFFANYEVTINRGDALGYTINVAGGGSYGYAIWIDFNQDGIFQVTEQVLTTSSYDYPPKTGTVTIPNTALLGTTRMRVLATYNSGYPSNPCNSYEGEYQDYAITIQQPVPVTYTSFTGKKEGSVNLLSWQTATEINNTGFELQRSADNKNFSKLNFIASKANNGNSNAVLSYNYTDAKPLASSNYYRLKQIDRDGKANYSNTILLKGNNVKQVSIVGAYPNPTRNILNVQIVAPAQERVSLVVTDITGKILQQETIVLNTGDNTKQIDVSKLTTGTYIVEIIDSKGSRATEKLIKN